MGPADGVTVTTRVTEQPEPRLYVIVVVPGAIPVTMPDVRPMVATDRALLAHVPPPGVPASVIVVPAHRLDGPEISGAAFTVTVFVDRQPPFE